VEDIGLSEKEIKACQKEMAALMEKFSSLEGAVLSTADGLLVASEDRSGNLEPDTISAISASMISLADTLAGQAGRPEVNNIISEAESSTLVILHAGEMILTVVGHHDTNIGLVLAAAKSAAKSIRMDTKEFSESLSGTNILSDPEALLERVRKEMKEMREGK